MGRNPVLLLLLAALLVACGGSTRPARSAEAPPRPAGPRVVAIGDLHGRLDVADRCLRLAGATDGRGAWIGGPLVVVQTGDQIDRGPDDRAVLDRFDALADRAAAAGGRVLSLLGNHETKNAEGRLRYVAPDAFAAFAEFHRPGASDADAERFPADRRGRRVAFRPGGPYAIKLARRPVLAAVGDTLFVHGSVAPEHVERGLSPLNDLARSWLLRGPVGDLPEALQRRNSPLWDRTYGQDPTPEDCATLGQLLGRLGLRRLVVGHTPQRGGITSACDGRVWRIDTGMWRRRRPGPVQVLEIAGGAERVLRAPAP